MVPWMTSVPSTPHSQLHAGRPTWRERELERTPKSQPTALGRTHLSSLLLGTGIGWRALGRPGRGAVSDQPRRLLSLEAQRRTTSCSRASGISDCDGWKDVRTDEKASGLDATYVSPSSSSECWMSAPSPSALTAPLPRLSLSLSLSLSPSLSQHTSAHFISLTGHAVDQRPEWSRPNAAQDFDGRAPALDDILYLKRTPDATSLL